MYSSISDNAPLAGRPRLKEKFSCKVAIVTGASSGIGEAIGITLAKAGAKVALAARRVDKLEDVKRTIEELGGVCIQVKTDVAVRSDVKIFEETESGKSLEPEDIANAVLYAVTQPDYVGVNEILVQPRDMPESESREETDIGEYVDNSETSPSQSMLPPTEAITATTTVISKVITKIDPDL
ncbi:unnamed protein product [Mytilus edulis]|uniref:Uncharacterized protein n=1 Tax=Mytilus edulis TaxID=6550 RepID=A0A8S3QAV5_MYTED|nr:unnamed protein product [Mytilus edulis]